MTPSPAVLYARLMSAARFRHLQTFAAVAEFGSVSRAASAIGLAQPAVTQLIADLERLLECQLFQRHARGMRMTATGRELLPYVLRALASLEGGAQFVAFRHTNAHRIVRVGAIMGAITGLLVRALPAFSESESNIMVQLQEADAMQTSALIARREVDLMLCRESAVWPEGWEFLPLLADRLVVVAGPQHPLVGKRALRFDGLLDETWFMLNPSTQARRTFDVLMASRNVAPRYGNIEVSSTPMMLAELRSKNLLSLIPYSVARQLIDLGLLAMLDVKDTPESQPLGVLSVKEELGEAAIALKIYLQRYARQHP